MDNFNLNTYFKNQYLSEGDITPSDISPYKLEKHPDIKILVDSLSKILGFEVAQSLGSGSYNGRGGYYIKMPRNGIRYWGDDSIKDVKSALEAANKSSDKYEFEYQGVSDYEIEPGERDWQASIGLFIKEKENINEMDINDPILVKMRAAKMQANQPKKSINPNYAAVKNASKIELLKKEREQLMRDMEQEAEPEGGPIADEYGSKLNRIDAAIAKLSGRKEMTYDQAIAESIPTVFSDKDYDDLLDIILKYVKDPDDAEDELNRFDDDGFDAMSDFVRANLDRDPEYKAWYNRVHSIKEAEYSLDFGELDESSSTEEKRIALRAIKSIAKYRGVSEDEAKRDLIRAAEELGSLKEAIQDITETIKLGKTLNEELCAKGKAYRKKRMAAGEKSSAYLNGRAVKVCKGQIKG